MKVIASFALLAALLVGACENKPTTEPTATEPAAEPAKAEPAAAEPVKAAESGASDAPAAPAGLVTVTAEGSKFDPPVKPEQIPDGAWYCDMGTVEYARLEKGDGKCPECGMFLKQKGAAAPADAHDHDHDHEGHTH